MSRISRFKKQAFLKVYPALKEVLDKENLTIDDLSSGLDINPISENLLRFVPIHHSIEGECGTERSLDKVAFVIQNKEDNEELLYNVVHRDCHHRYTKNHWGDETSDGETILEAIDRLGIDPSKIKYILVYARRYDDYSSRAYIDDHYISIYQTSKNLNIDYIIKNTKEEAEKALMAEVNS